MLLHFVPLCTHITNTVHKCKHKLGVSVLLPTRNFKKQKHIFYIKYVHMTKGPIYTSNVSKSRCNFIDFTCHKYCMSLLAGLIHSESWYSWATCKSALFQVGCAAAPGAVKMSGEE